MSLTILLSITLLNHLGEDFGSVLIVVGLLSCLSQLQFERCNLLRFIFLLQVLHLLLGVLTSDVHVLSASFGACLEQVGTDSFLS